MTENDNFVNFLTENEKSVNFLTENDNFVNFLTENDNLPYLNVRPQKIALCDTEEIGFFIGSKFEKNISEEKRKSYEQLFLNIIFWLLSIKLLCKIGKTLNLS